MIRGEVGLAGHVEMLRFDPEAHLYTIRGGDAVLPNITGVLKDEGIQGYFQGWEETMRFGRWVHKAVALYEERTLDESTLIPSVRGCLESYKLWKDAVRFKAYIAEEKMWHTFHRFAGTPDLVGTVGGVDRWHVVELKAGVYRAGDMVQVGAQGLLVRDCVIDARGAAKLPRGMVVYLKENGNPPKVERMDETRMRVAGEDFVAALRINRWKKAHAA